jgi:two-component system, NtrC family, response regulator HydG
MRARLTVETGSADPSVLELDAEAIRLGRNRRNSMVLQDQHASRWHAEIYPSDGRWYIRDRDTTNGTKLNGHRIRRPTALENGQEIGIGDVRLRFTLADPDTGTAEMPVVVNNNHLLEESSLSDSSNTLLHPDELTALVNFMSGAEGSPGDLIGRALDLIHRQVRADTCGFLSLDAEDPDFKVVYPTSAQVDVHLSRQLTQRVLKEGQRVWLSASPGNDLESESLVHFRDALCIPLRANKAGEGPDDRELPLGALHVYRSNRLFSEREVHFCEVLAGYLAKTLDAQRARRALEADNSRLSAASPASGDELVGGSPAVQQLRERIARLADGPPIVLVVGESGVGKELVALGLHRRSRRAGGPLVPVNCAAITASMPEAELFGHVKGTFTGAIDNRDGLFLQADDGTLFLDEIGELSLEVQAMLLRVLETRKFRPVGGKTEIKANVRIIAATNRDLGREVAERRFRQDLFFRLGQPLKVPPLREHLDDIPALVNHFLARLCVEYKRRVTLTEAALNRLQTYCWPGNVRQLRSVLETAVAMSESGVIHAGDLHLVDELNVPQGEGPASLNLEELEMWAIRRALGQTGGNNTQAAKLLGIHRDTLIAKQRKYQIDRKNCDGLT